MAEIDAKPAEAVPEVVAEANDAPAAEEVAKTDAAPAAPMGRIKKPVRPDSDVVKKEIEELNEQSASRSHPRSRAARGRRRPRGPRARAPISSAARLCFSPAQ